MRGAERDEPPDRGERVAARVGAVPDEVLREPGCPAECGVPAGQLVLEADDRAGPRAQRPRRCPHAHYEVHGKRAGVRTSGERYAEQRGAQAEAGTTSWGSSRQGMRAPA